MRHPGYFLRGDYFNEDKEEDGSPKVACRLNAKDGAASVSATIGLAVRPGDLWLLEDGDISKGRRDDAGMVERIAAMAVLKAIKKKDIGKFEGELPGARQLRWPVSDN